MQDLRLIGVHEDGQHLLLADADGGRYRLALDDALRAAARRDRPRLGQLQIEIEGGLRPRDVQALVRRGLSTEEVADRAGWTVEKVRRFEGRSSPSASTSPASPSSAPSGAAAPVRSPSPSAWPSACGTAASTATTSSGTPPATRRALVRDHDLPRRRSPAHGHLALRAARRLGHRHERRGPLAQRGGRAGRHPDAAPGPHLGDLDVYDIDADGGVDAGTARGPARADRPHGRDARAQRPVAVAAAAPRPSQTPGDEHPRADALPIEDLALDPAGPPPPPAARAATRCPPTSRSRRPPRGRRPGGRPRVAPAHRVRWLGQRPAGPAAPVPPLGPPRDVGDGLAHEARCAPDGRPAGAAGPAPTPERARAGRACRAGTTSSSAPGAAARPEPPRPP